MLNKIYSRRDLLKSSVLGAVSAVIGPLILSACQKSCSSNSSSRSQTQDSAAGSAGSDLPASCPPDTNLSADQLAIRQNLKYVDQTPIPTRKCNNCKLYTKPAANSGCGGCTIVPGPIHPHGYCLSWYQMM